MTDIAKTGLSSESPNSEADVIVPDRQPGIPTGPGPDHIPGSPPIGGPIDSGKPGEGGIQPVPNPSGIPGRPHASEGDDKGDLAPGLDDIKRGAR